MKPLRAIRVIGVDQKIAKKEKNSVRLSVKVSTKEKQVLKSRRNRYFTRKTTTNTKR